jgi:hypothetical protein
MKMRTRDEIHDVVKYSGCMVAAVDTNAAAGVTRFTTIGG